MSNEFDEIEKVVQRKRRETEVNPLVGILIVIAAFCVAVWFGFVILE